VNLKKIGTWVLVAFLIWWVIQQPHAAAGTVHNLGHVATHAANGLSAFASNL
jgi:hypothetical protein